MIQKYLIIGAVVAALAGGGAYGFKLYLDEKVSHGLTKQSLSQVTGQLVQYEEDLANLRGKQVTLETKNKDISLEQSEYVRELNGHRNREDVILKKKSRITIRINKAYQKRQRKLACVTGDFALCE